jgi:4-amino-4-deoxy-L-arabinose transferase-like glycosyltransferase
MALFVRLEFASPPEPGGRFLGRRSWALLGFFALLGVTNSAKGLFFGMMHAAVPAAAFLLGQLRWSALRRYVSLWGWLAFAAAALAWPLAAYLRYPDVTDLWASDYLGRLNRGYMGEPPWYYLAQVPWVVFPWTLPALVGLGLALRPAWAGRRAPERFLILWAVLPVLCLSVPQGKHHHYLLHSLAPWAVMAAVGMVRIWRWLATSQTVLRSWWLPPLLFGLGGDLVVVILHRRHPEQVPYLPVLLAGWPAYVALCWWAYRQPKARVAAGVSLALLVVGFWLSAVYDRYYRDGYRADYEFVGEVRERAGDGKPLLVLNNIHPLDASWMLFYLPPEARLLHNDSFLHDERIGADVVHVVARGYDEPLLARYGTARVVAASRVTRGRNTGAERWMLYELRFREGLWRGPVDARISPMQATGRDAGPVVTPPGDELADSRG